MKGRPCKHDVSGYRTHFAPDFCAGLRFRLVALLILATLPTGCDSSGTKEPLEIDSAYSEQLFRTHCARCHGIFGGGGTGPSLTRARLSSAPDSKALAELIREGIPGTGMPGSWMLSEREIDHIVHFVQELSLRPVEAPTGDPEKGLQAYTKGLCHTCHIVAGTGVGIGPELTDIGNRRGVAYLRRAILHPGQEMPLDEEGFQAFLVVRILTSDGREIRGRRVNEDSFTIQLRDVGNVHHSFRKSELRELRREVQSSLMPDFEDALSPDEIEHLIAYLAGLRGES